MGEDVLSPPDSRHICQLDESDLHPTPPSSIIFFKDYFNDILSSEKEKPPLIPFLCLYPEHVCVLCCRFCFTPSLLEGGMAHWKFPPFALYVLFSLSVSPASRGRPPCLLLLQEQIHISIKRKVPPASAAVPTYRLPTGRTVASTSHRIRQQTWRRHSRAQRNVPQTHLNRPLVREKKDEPRKNVQTWVVKMILHFQLRVGRLGSSYDCGSANNLFIF